MIVDKICYKNYINDKLNPRLANSIDYTNLNVKTLKRILSEFYNLASKYDIYGESLMSEFVYDLTCAIYKCDFTDIQFKRLKLWMYGYNEREIAEKENVSRWVVSKSIRSSCEKIIQCLRKENEL